MRTETECETCGGDRYLIGDVVDRLNECDDERPCPDCNAQDDSDTGKFERVEAEHVERAFDFGGES